MKATRHLIASALLMWLLAPTTAVAQADAGDDAWIERTAETGPVEAVVRVRPIEPKIGDAIELELIVRSESEVEVLMPEFGEALGRFQIVDFAPRNRIEEDGRRVAAQRYTLAPTLSGAHRVPPLLVEFIDHRPGHDPAPADEDAYELLTEAIDFEVSSVLADDAPRELRSPLGVLPPLRSTGSGAVLWGIAGLVGLLAAAFFAFRYFTVRRITESPFAAAKRELAALLAEGRPAADDRPGIDAFFVSLSSIVRRYIENRFALRSPELTTEEFLSELQRSPDLLRSHQALLAELLGVADLVKFARHTPDPLVIDHSVEIAERFLEATREAEDASPASGPGSPGRDVEAAGV